MWTIHPYRCNCAHDMCRFICGVHFNLPTLWTPIWRRNERYSEDNQSTPDMIWGIMGKEGRHPPYYRNSSSVSWICVWLQIARSKAEFCKVKWLDDCLCLWSFALVEFPSFPKQVGELGAICPIVWWTFGQVIIWWSNKFDD